MAADPLDVPAASAAVSQPAAGVSVRPPLGWPGRLLYGAMAGMILVFVVGVWVNLRPVRAPAMVETAAVTPSGSIVTATSAAGQNPLAPVDGDRQTAWSASVAGSSWLIELPCRKTWQLRCWAGASGVWPTTTGWQSSVDGVQWTPVALTAHGGQTATPADPGAFAEGRVEAQFLRYRPEATPAGILEIELR